MNKENQIERMADLIDHNKYVRTSEQVACILFDDGYRKSDEVRKETAKEILCRLKKAIVGKLQTDYEIIDNLLWEYGVEVDE